MLAAPHLHNPLTLLRFAAPSSDSHASDGHEHTTAPRVLPQPPPVSKSTPVSASHMVYLLKRPRCDLVCVHPSQSRPNSHMSVPPKWEHIMCAQLLPTREVQVPPWREPTILSIQILVQVLALFLNRSFFLWSSLGNQNLTGLVTLIQPTAISCIVNTVSLSFNGIQARREEILPTLSPLPVVSIMQLFFKKPVITSRTSLSSSLCAPAIPTIKTPLSLIQKFSQKRLTPQAKGTLGMVLLIV